MILIYNIQGGKVNKLGTNYGFCRRWEILRKKHTIVLKLKTMLIQSR